MNYEIISVLSKCNNHNNLSVINAIKYSAELILKKIIIN